MSQSARRGATLEDFFAIPEGERFHELIDGSLSQKAAPSGEHGAAQAGVARGIGSPFHRKGGGGGPGGWWIATEVEILLESGEIVRPDVLGWKRERCPEKPTGTPVKLRPDWVCEILSPGNASDDTVKKLRLYQRSMVPHYWIIDPRDSTLTVMRWSADGYITLMRAERTENVRAEPFQAVELAVATLFGDDPPESPV
jgi:Uma2 family endonuclease